MLETNIYDNCVLDPIGELHLFVNGKMPLYGFSQRLANDLATYHFRTYKMMKRNIVTKVTRG